MSQKSQSDKIIGVITWAVIVIGLFFVGKGIFIGLSTIFSL